MGDENASFLKYNELIDGMTEPEEDLTLHIMKHLDLFFTELKIVLVSICPEDLLEYQRKILYQQEFSIDKGSQVEMPRRWVDYFDAFKKNPFEKINWPKEGKVIQYKIDSSSLRFPTKVWFSLNIGTRRWKAYYDQIVQHNIPGNERTIFKKLERSTVRDIEPYERGGKNDES